MYSHLCRTLMITIHDHLLIPNLSYVSCVFPRAHPNDFFYSISVFWILCFTHAFLYYSSIFPIPIFFQPCIPWNWAIGMHSYGIFPLHLLWTKGKNRKKILWKLSPMKFLWQSSNPKGAYPYGKTTGGAVRPSPSSFPVSHVQNSSNPSHCRAHSRVVNYMYGWY